MIDSRPDGRKAEVPAGKSRWIQGGVLAGVCVLVVGIYACTARSGVLELLSQNAAEAYYNLLVQGFRAGQLSLKKEVPPGLAQLADPYDPAANGPYRTPPHRMLDLSYYKGRLYLYFGVTPALILFWPFVALTGHCVLHKQAVALFCAIGFLTSVALLRALWRRYFAEVSVGVVAAGVLALGLATGVPVMLQRCDVYEVPISCGYMLTMLALGAIWCALHETERSCRWLAAASVAYGLAVGARPSLLLGAVILLVPVARAWRERRKVWVPLIAATGPLVLIGLGLMLYNALRFENPFEFGWHYQLAGSRQDTVQPFSLHYLWFTFRVYFLEPAPWSSRFPFVHEITVPPLPTGQGWVEMPFGALTNVPLVWLALAVLLGWRDRSTEERSVLRGIVTAVALLFGICALTTCLFFSACIRYEVEFLPALVLLAVVGILGVERALALNSKSGLAGRPVWRLAVRGGWSLLLGFSVAFNLLASVVYQADGRYWLGVVLAQGGQVSEAIQIYEEVLRISPDFAQAHNNLGAALEKAGRLQEAMGQYEQALRIKPDYTLAHYNLGVALGQAGKTQEAIIHLQLALQHKSDYAEARYSLGLALAQLGRIQEATEHWEEARSA